MQSQLHPVLSNDMLPPALLQPLKFGDPAQIKAMYELDNKIAKMTAEADEQGVAIEDLRQYQVTVTVEAEYTVTILAASKEAAVEKAKEEHEDLCAWELDFDVDYYAREVKARRANGQ
jgi:hypothetical protein